MAAIILDPTRLRALYRLSAEDVLKVARIKLSVVAVTGVSLEELAGRRRTARIAEARQLAMTLIRKATSLSLVDVGGLFDDRDHSTVLHAMKVIEWRAKREAEFGRLYSKLLSQAKA